LLTWLTFSDHEASRTYTLSLYNEDMKRITGKYIKVSLYIWFFRVHVPANDVIVIWNMFVRTD